jgi:iron complex transport system substrate-binding protein
VVGVTYECNEPVEAATRPHVTDTIIPAGSPPAEIDRLIGEAVAEGRELYRLDRELLAALDPDLIVSQDLCRVCALPAGDVSAALAVLGCRAEVFSYDPMTLGEVLSEIERLAAAVGAEPTAAAGIAALRRRLAAVATAVKDRTRPKVLLLEWTDPPYVAGHWIPDQISAAGGEPVLARPGGRSEAVGWDEVAASGAEVLLVAPCGYDEAGARRQLAEVVARGELGSLPAVRQDRVFAIDADAYVVRPGPRLVDGVERMAALFHPGLVPAGP